MTTVVNRSFNRIMPTPLSRLNLCGRQDANGGYSLTPVTAIMIVPFWASCVWGCGSHITLFQPARQYECHSMFYCCCGSSCFERPISSRRRNSLAFEDCFDGCFFGPTAVPGADANWHWRSFGKVGHEGNFNFYLLFWFNCSSISQRLHLLIHHLWPRSSNCREKGPSGAIGTIQC